MNQHALRSRKTISKSEVAYIYRELLLTIGAILGTVCIVLTLASVVLGIKPLIFRSGSMAPAIETGALAFAKPVAATELGVGDVVSVITESGVRITHRITKISPQGKNAALTLKGDANSVEDADNYMVPSVDRVLFSIPKAGYLIAWISGPIGTFTAGIFVALALILAFRRRPSNRHHAAAKKEGNR